MKDALELLGDLGRDDIDWLLAQGDEWQIISGTEPGGKIILGNFHPKNTTKVVMDHVLDWKLIHRSEADMDRLYAASLFAKKCTQVRFEARGVNLFAECVK